MDSNVIPQIQTQETLSPRCSVFGQCGGCSHQDLTYEAELQLKASKLRELFKIRLGIGPEVFTPIEASPKDFSYRHRLDITLKRSRAGLLFGFQSPITRQMVEIESCPIAMESVSDFLPQLRREACAMIPDKYRTANLVVRTGDDGRVCWGGIGRHSLVMREEDYLWTEINGKKIFYSLETFFQANLSILPKLINKVTSLLHPDKQTLFLDLYAGVGLFGISAASQMGKVILVEDCPGSVKLAAYNVKHHQLENVEIRSRRMEEELSVLEPKEFRRTVAMIDPPRAGLSLQACEAVSGAVFLEKLLYLSCHPESLVRDLEIFLRKGWEIQTVIPFDFFPRTSHLETLAVLLPPRRQREES